MEPSHAEADEARFVFSTHLPSVRRTARALVGPDEAEDVVQEACVRALAHGTDSIRDKRAWLCAVTRRLAIDVHRRRTRRREVAASTVAVDGNESPRSADGRGLDRVGEGGLTRTLRAEENEALRRAMSRLAPGQRETVRLRYFEGLSLAEIAAARGCALGTVKATLHRAMEILRRDLRATNKT